MDEPMKPRIGSLIQQEMEKEELLWIKTQLERGFGTERHAPCVSSSVHHATGEMSSLTVYRIQPVVLF